MDASSHGILAVLIMVGAPGFDQQLLNQPVLTIFSRQIGWGIQPPNKTQKSVNYSICRQFKSKRSCGQSEFVWILDKFVNYEKNL